MYESGLRFRLYGYEKLFRDKLFGELIISVIEFDLEGDGEVLWWIFILRNVFSVSLIFYEYEIIFRLFIIFLNFFVEVIFEKVNEKENFCDWFNFLFKGKVLKVVML